MKPYRRRLIGLPLQRSLFSGIAHAPAAIGVHGILPGDRFAAWLDDHGDLYLDQANVDALTAALPALATPGFLREMQSRLTATCHAVVETTDRSRRRAASASDAEVRALLSDLGAMVAAFIPFAILSKFIPDALYRILSSVGEPADPPFPAVSPGAELTRAAAALCGACRARGFSPDRMRTEWPDVAPDLAEMVNDFCRAQTGFGPLAWEAPGYEDPRYVFGILAGTFGDDDPEILLQRFRPAPPSPGRADDSPLREVLAAWLTFLERETWYVRRAFYAGFLPLLRRCAPAYQLVDPDFVAEDLLFLELDELKAPAVRNTAAVRRAKYLADHDYYAKYGVTAERLRAVMEAG